ncbi:MAG TPA: tripartite tricarboxylate transporter substrate-binding protein [Burkholderiales bacterium]|nr:tripartite tricarboxylate transporter substrate-binding protein [Burkholderiales bacterium]
MKPFAYAAIATSLSLLFTDAGAQSYPSKPLRIVLPVPPGGVADVAARPLAHDMTQILGQQVILDYRPGATGAIGIGVAAKSPADGYTLLWGSTNTMCMGPAYYGKTPPIGEFTAITPVIVFHNVLVVHPALPARTTQQLVKLAKARAEKLNFGSAGTGSVNHLTAGMFEHLTGVKVNHVAYKGGGPALTDVMGGHVDGMFATSPSAVTHLKSGKLKALMITSEKRVAALPEVPSAPEAGIPGLVVATWNGVFAPAGTPPAIVGQLNTTIVKAAGGKDMTDRMTSVAAQVYTLAPEKFGAVVRDDYARWAAVVKATGIKGGE